MSYEINADLLDGVRRRRRRRLPDVDVLVREIYQPALDTGGRPRLQLLLFRHDVLGLERARVIGRPGLLRRGLFLVLLRAHILKSGKWSPRLVRSRKTSPTF